MKTYKPGTIQDPTLAREMASITQAANRPDRYLLLEILDDASKVPERLQKEMLVRVDATLGATVAFGSGAGLYRRSDSNASWIYIG